MCRRKWFVSQASTLRRAACAGALAWLIPVGLACAAATDSRPSIVLIVLDTLRADAVSAYGEIEGTTPALDALAREGLLYRRTYAPAPWTLPSHATLLSGLPVEVHRTGMPGRGRMPEEIVTLAESLGSAGYETMAISENAVLSEPFGVLQGFKQRFASAHAEDGQFIFVDALDALESWLDSRTPDEAPLFVFVNLMDPHSPYEIRDENPFVSKEIPRDRLAARAERPGRMICGGVPPGDGVEILRGLYHGDVHAGDAKAAKVIARLRERTGTRSWITIVTSDHGEYFGEDRLLGHEFGLHDAVLRVPLIVHGLPGVEPGAMNQIVTLGDIAPSILAWTGVPGAEELPGRLLPTIATESELETRSIFAAYHDENHWRPDSWEIGMQPVDLNANRQFCTPADPVWGGMAALIRYPYKFRWFAQFPPALYDLSWDTAERSNLASQRPELVTEFTRSIEPLLRSAGLKGGVKADAQPLSEEARRALKALGYID